MIDDDDVMMMMLGMVMITVRRGVLPVSVSVSMLAC